MPRLGTNAAVRKALLAFALAAFAACESKPKPLTEAQTIAKQFDGAKLNVRGLQGWSESGQEGKLLILVGPGLSEALFLVVGRNHKSYPNLEGVGVGSQVLLKYSARDLDPTSKDRSNDYVKHLQFEKAQK